MASNITASNSFSWADVDWEELRRLRARFLRFDEPDTGPDAAPGPPPPGDAGYWASARALASYDFTFAERIGWKWDTVLAELQWRGWTPPPGAVLDWGCGTAVASRRVAAAWPAGIHELLLWDHSPPARDFSLARAQAALPGIPVRHWEEALPVPPLLILSHVLNELSPAAAQQLLRLALRARAILWVEPGTWSVSRKLIAMRETLLASFRAVAPCTHLYQCGMLSAGNQRHWCHHFAHIPGHVHTDSGWGRFSAALQIDLSTLPFSYLVLDRRPAGDTLESPASRLIGRPRHYKGCAKILSCQSDGVRELTLARRDAPALFRELKKDPGTRYHWQREQDKIRAGARLF